MSETKNATVAVIEAINRWHPERDVVAVNVVYTYVEHASNDPEHKGCQLDWTHFGGVVFEGIDGTTATMASLAAATTESGEKLQARVLQSLLGRSPFDEAGATRVPPTDGPDAPASDPNDIPAPIADLLRAMGIPLSAVRRG